MARSFGGHLSSWFSGPLLSAPGFLAPGYPPPGYPPSVPRPRFRAPCYPLPVPHSWFPLLAPRSGLSAPGYPSRLFVPGSRSRSLASRLSASGPSLPGYPLPGYPSPASRSGFLRLLGRTSPSWIRPRATRPVCRHRSVCPRVSSGVIARDCSPRGSSGYPRIGSRGASRGSLPRRRLTARTFPDAPLRGDASCARGPRAGHTAPGRLPSSGLSPAPRCAHPGSRTPMSLARRTLAVCPCCQPGGPLPVVDAPGAQPPAAPAAPAVRDRSALGTGGCRGGVVASKARGGLPGRCCAAVVGGRGGEHGPVTGACPPGVPSSRSCPGTVSPGGGRPARGDTRLAARRIRRGAHGSGPSRGGADGSADSASPRCRVPAARRGCPPHPAAPHRTPPHPAVPRRTLPAPGELGVALAAMIRGAGGYPPWRHTPVRPGEGASGGPRRILAAVAHIGAPGEPPGVGSGRGCCNAALHPAGSPPGHGSARGTVTPHYSRRGSRGRGRAGHGAEAPGVGVGPGAVMRHYTRRGAPRCGVGPGAVTRRYSQRAPAHTAGTGSRVVVRPRVPERHGPCPRVWPPPPLGPREAGPYRVAPTT